MGGGHRLDVGLGRSLISLAAVQNLPGLFLFSEKVPLDRDTI